MQPGQTISPEDEPKDTPVEQPEVQNDPVQEPAAEEPSPWQFSQEDGESALPQPSVNPVIWTASEFVDHEKNASWFMVLGVLTIGVVALIYLITRDILPSVFILLTAGLFGVAAKRKPRTLEYKIDATGITIGSKLYPHAELKSFAILEEGPFNSIQLMPLKRFMPPISLYCPPEQEEEVVNALGNYLPHEKRSHDPIDRLMRKVRF